MHERPIAQPLFGSSLPASMTRDVRHEAHPSMAVPHAILLAWEAGSRLGLIRATCCQRLPPWREPFWSVARSNELWTKSFPVSVPQHWFARTSEEVALIYDRVIRDEQTVIDLYSEASLLRTRFATASAFDASEFQRRNPAQPDGGMTWTRALGERLINDLATHGPALRVALLSGRGPP